MSPDRNQRFRRWSAALLEGPALGWVALMTQARPWATSCGRKFRAGLFVAAPLGITSFVCRVGWVILVERCGP